MLRRIIGGLRKRRLTGGLIVPKGESHRCVFPSGYEDVYPHPVVAVIVQNALGQIALVERHPNEPDEGGKLALPGGYLQKYETFDGCAEKEVLEETGYELAAGTLRHFAVMDGPTNLPGRQNEVSGNVVTVYTAAAGDKVGEHDHEVSGVVWVPGDRLPPRTRMAFGHFDILGMHQRHQVDPFPEGFRPSSMTPEQLFLPGWVLDSGAIVSAPGP